MKIVDLKKKTIIAKKKIIQKKEKVQNHQNQTLKPQETPQSDDSLQDEELLQKPQQKHIIFKDFKPIQTLPAIFTGGQVMTTHDEKLLLSLNNFKISIYDLQHNQLIKNFQHNEEEIIAFSINPKQNILSTFTRNYILRLISFPDLQVQKELKIHDFFCTQMTMDHFFVYLGSNLGTIKIFDFKLQATHEFRGKGGSVLQMKTHPNYQKLELFVGGEDSGVRQYDLVLNKLIKTYQTKGIIKIRLYYWNVFY